MPSAFIFLLFTFLPSALYASPYEFKPFDYPGAFHTLPVAINDHGHVVGRYRLDGPGLAEQSFYYDGANFYPIELDSVSRVLVWDINNSGTVVGEYILDSGHSRNFIYEENQVIYTDYRTTLPVAGFSRLRGINNQGDLIGYYYTGTGKNFGFIDTGSNVITIDDDLERNGLLINGINDSETVVGYHIVNGTGQGFVWRDEGFYQMPPDMSFFSNALDNNNDDLVVGFIRSFKPIGFLYDGIQTTLLDFPAVNRGTYASGINNRGTVVGRYEARDDDGLYRWRGFIATPIPTPPTILLIGAGLIGLLYQNIFRVKP